LGLGSHPPEFLAGNTVLQAQAAGRLELAELRGELKWTRGYWKRCPASGCRALAAFLHALHLPR
jgi:hypothetical protein